MSENNDTTNKVTELNVRHEPDPAVDPAEYQFGADFIELCKQSHFSVA